MKKNMKKLFIFCCVILIMISSFSNVSAEILNEADSNLFLNGLISEKVDGKIYEISDEIDKIPVYIWYNDINYDIVENDVFDELGYNIETIEKFNLIGNTQEKIDNYIEASRKIAEKMFYNKSIDIINLTGISDKIEFVSSYAPVIIADLSIEEIEVLALSPLIDSIGYYVNSESMSINEDESVWNDSTVDSYLEDRITFINTFINDLTDGDINIMTGLTGKDVKVGILEPGSPSFNDTYLPSTRYQIIGANSSDEIYYTEHATIVAYIMSSINGLAPESQLYSKSRKTNPQSNDTNLIRDIECFLDNGVKLVNMSCRMLETDEAYLFAEAYINYIVKNHNVIFVKSAGNTANWSSNTGNITKPGNADNIITVGAFDNKYKTLCNFSSYVETYGCEKPDVVASACIYDNASELVTSGTSFSAPVVTGTIALMLECRPTLALYPEVVKAIVMASCHNKVPESVSSDNTESMYDGITEKQGAGVFDPYMALCIASNGNYGHGLINEGASEKVKFDMSPYDAQSLNVSLSWLRNANFTDNSYIDPVIDDLDLYVYKNSFSVFDVNDNPNKTSSSSEMVYSLINSAARIYDSEINYELEIKYNNDDTDNSVEPVRFGYAWSCDTDCYSKLEEYEGLYYIKNVANNKYLTYNYDKEELEFKEFMGHYYNEYEQLFVITRQENGTYKIGSYYSPYNTGLGMSGTSVTHNSLICDITIELTPDGYFNFISDYEYLNSLGGVTWETKPYVTNNECWILEKVNYKLGDVDMSGSINETDYNYIIDYCDGTYTPTNSEWLLSDTNGDGILNYGDLDLLESHYIQ